MGKWTVPAALGLTLVFSIVASAEEGLRAPAGVRGGSTSELSAISFQPSAQTHAWGELPIFEPATAGKL